MFFGINEIMEKAKKAYAKLLKKCLTTKETKRATSKRKK
jgi:hypothetical protein